MDWDRLKTFYRVAQYKSFTDASVGMHLSQPALSRQIMSLEDSMGIRLFYRESRGLTLTEEGKEWFETVGEIYKKIEEKNIEVNQRRKDPKGYLRIAATSGFVSSYLSYVLKDFLELYPKIRLSIVASNFTPDLKLRESDILIHPYIDDESGLIQRELCTFHEKLYASPKYLKEFGVPQKPKDLDIHRLLISDNHPSLFGDAEDWQLMLGREKDNPRDPYLSIGTSIGLFHAAQAGLGIISLPREHPDLKTSDLVPVLPSIDGPATKAYIIYLDHFKGMKRIELFCDYLEKIFKQKPLA